MRGGLSSTISFTSTAACFFSASRATEPEPSDSTTTSFSSLLFEPSVRGAALAKRRTRTSPASPRESSYRTGASVSSTTRVKSAWLPTRTSTSFAADAWTPEEGGRQPRGPRPRSHSEHVPPSSRPLPDFAVAWRPLGGTDRVTRRLSTRRRTRRILERLDRTEEPAERLDRPPDSRTVPRDPGAVDQVDAPVARGGKVQALELVRVAVVEAVGLVGEEHHLGRGRDDVRSVTSG